MTEAPVTATFDVRSNMSDPLIAETPCVNGCCRIGPDGDVIPLPSRHGYFCLRCYGKAERALKYVPDLVEHIVSNFPGKITKAATDIRVGGTSERSLGAFSEQAWVDADQLYALLVKYASQWAKGLGVTPPAPAQYAWRVEHKTVIGLPASIKTEDARFAAGVMATWIHIHLPSIFERNTGALILFIEDLTLVGEIAARWPTDTKPRWSDMVHQDGCGGRIAYYPPGTRGADIVIACEKCHHRFELDEYEEAVHEYRLTVQAEKREASRAARAATRKKTRAAEVQAHLTGKYLR